MLANSCTNFGRNGHIKFDAVIRCDVCGVLINDRRG